LKRYTENMNYKDIRVGQRVTWGMTKPTGEVVAVDPRRMEAPVIVKLTKTVQTSCGRTFPAGLEAHFSPGELSLLV